MYNKTTFTKKCSLTVVLKYINIYEIYFIPTQRKIVYRYVFITYINII